MIVYIKHIDIEGPETLGDFFKAQGFHSQTIELYNGDTLPKSFNEIEAVVCLGGPMNVYEEDKYPYLKEENIFIQNVIDKQIPFLGLCLGSQLLSKACGAKVMKSPQKEIGFHKVTFTEQGKCDNLLRTLSGELCVFQWHEDMFEVPDSGVLLATSEDCPHQAFRFGKNAYGLQFHVEITEKSIEIWSDAYFQKGNKTLADKKKQMLMDYHKNKNVFTRSALVMYNNFLSIIKG